MDKFCTIGVVRLQMQKVRERERFIKYPQTYLHKPATSQLPAFIETLCLAKWHSAPYLYIFACFFYTADIYSKKTSKPCFLLLLPQKTSRESRCFRAKFWGPKLKSWSCRKEPFTKVCPRTSYLQPLKNVAIIEENQKQGFSFLLE